jgi:CHAT domain-containing protein
VDRGDLAGAEAYQKRALALRRKDRAILPVAASLGALGRIERLKGRLDLATNYYRDALQIGGTFNLPSANRATFLAGLGDVYRDRGAFAEAERQYRRALTILDELAPRTFGRAEALAALGSTLRSEGRLHDATESYRRALDEFEYQTSSVGPIAEMRARFRARKLQHYRDYLDLLIEQGQAELAFETLDNSHARSLFEMLNQAQIEVHQGVDASLRSREQDVGHLLNAKEQYRIRLLNEAHGEEQLAALDRELTSLWERYQRVQAEIRTSSPGFAALTQPQPLSLSQIQALLDPETVLLEYSLGEKHSDVWLVTDHSLEVFELPKRETIEHLAIQLYRAMTGRTNATHGDPAVALPNPAKDRFSEQLALRLSRMILWPVRGRIAGKRLLIVSDGALQYVPFSALPAPGDPGTPLLVQHEIVNLPSASVLAEIRRSSSGRPRPSKEVAVLADPVFDGADDRVRRRVNRPFSRDASVRASQLLSRSAEDVGYAKRGGLHLERLRYSRKEAEAILAVTGSAALAALDFKANRKTAMGPELGRYRIIHFATHGFVDSKHPEFSGLVLSLVNQRGKPQDGFLTLGDIYNLELPVDMVVLSACRTALGEEISGEGLLGLTRGFMYAGASRVVASLWNVNDLATSELMARFYEAMEREKLTPAAALRKAQIELRKNKRWRSPYYWAGFLIEGEWN